MASAEDGKKGLGLFDAISIIVGIVIGTTIFKLPFVIFGNTSGPLTGLLVWLLGGVLALIGALCYAELATTYPRAGGDYYYITRAYGQGMGFLFGWAQLLVVFTASIGAMAFVFGEFAIKVPFLKQLEDHVDLKQLDAQLGDVGLNWEFAWACLAVIVFTFVNLLGVLMGKITQNLLTLIKIVSLGAILVAGFAFSQSSPMDWRFTYQKATKFEGTGGEGKNKEFTFRAASEKPTWEVALSLTPDDKLKATFRNLQKDPQKLDLKLLVHTSTNPEDAPDVVEASKDYPMVPPERPDTEKKEDKEKTTKEKSQSQEKTADTKGKGETVKGKPESGKTVEISLPPGRTRTGIYGVDQVVVPRKSFGWEALAIILVLFAYGGWNDAAFVAAEVRNPQRNIPRALIFGVTLITLVYLAVNAAYISGLGFEDASKPGVPANLLEHAVTKGLGDDWKDWGSQGMSILIIISALGAVSGLILTGARVYATLGNDYLLFSWLGHWKPGRRTPILALFFQGVFTLGMIFMLGTDRGHLLINDLLSSAHIKHESDWTGDKAFEALVAHTAPVFWIFFLMTGFSLFMLRARDTQLKRSFSVPLYPWLPIIFCGTCVYMIFQSTIYVGWRSLFAMGLVLLGIPFYWLACLFGGYRGDVVKAKT